MLARVMNDQPIGTALNWDQIALQPFMVGIIDDPRVQAAMAKYEKDEAALRNEIRAFLASRGS